MIGVPPVEDGAVHVRITDPLPDVANGSVGADALADGTATTPALEDPEPARFTARTRYKYVVPFESEEST